MNDWMIERTIFAKSEIQIAVSSKYMHPPIYSCHPSWSGNNSNNNKYNNDNDNDNDNNNNNKFSQF